MAYDFRWNSWNIEHIGEHNVTPAEAEYVVNRAKAPFPQYRGDGKWLAIGQTASGEYVQVIFVLDDDGAVFVIHARPLTNREKRGYRRRRK